MYKRILCILTVLTLLVGILSACSIEKEIIEKDENPFFSDIEPAVHVKPLESESSTPVVLDVPEEKPQVVEIINKSKINIISQNYHEFHSQLYNLLTRYEHGDLLSIVNVFLNTKIKDDYLISEEVDRQIIKNTQIEILNSLLVDGKLTLDIKIDYIPILVNLLLADDKLETNIDSFMEYSNMKSQTEYFTLTFDINKFSKSEGIKIKDYRYKDYIIRALTNTIYDSKKYILEYSDKNNQEQFNKVVKDLKNTAYTKQEWLTETTITNISENQEFFNLMLNSFSIKSITEEYYIITYIDVKNNIDNYELNMDNIMGMIRAKQIPSISKIVHDPDLSKLHNFFRNLMIL